MIFYSFILPNTYLAESMKSSIPRWCLMMDSLMIISYPMNSLNSMIVLWWLFGVIVAGKNYYYFTIYMIMISIDHLCCHLIIILANSMHNHATKWKWKNLFMMKSIVCFINLPSCEKQKQCERTIVKEVKTVWWSKFSWYFKVES